MHGYLIIVLVILTWGLWGFVGKLATRYNHAFIITGIGSILGALLGVLFLVYTKAKGFSFNLSFKPVLFIALSCITGFVGTILFYMALKKLPTSIVIPLTGLYPIVTVALSTIFLKESFPIYKWIGLIILLTGVVIVTWEMK